jgi:hypothetical protein
VSQNDPDACFVLTIILALDLDCSAAGELNFAIFSPFWYWEHALVHYSNNSPITSLECQFLTAELRLSLSGSWGTNGQSDTR